MNVIRVNNANVRFHIENFTLQFCFPDAIKFVQDGNGDWITSIENLQNIRYTGLRDDLKQYLNDNGISTNVRSLKQALEQWGEIITHVPPAKQTDL